MISILVNNYNNGPWLQACLDSVLSQTRPPDEVIVYDDGSTDESLASARAYGRQIRLIEGEHDPHLGGLASQARAVGRAFAASRGEHVYLLDGDDTFLPDKISRYERAWAEQPDAVLVQAPTILIAAEGRIERSGYERLKHPAGDDFRGATLRHEDTDLYYTTSALAFRRSYLEAMLPLDYADGVALAVDNRLAALAPWFGPVVGLTEPATYWRQHARSMSRQGTQRDPLAGTLRRVSYFNARARSLGCRRLQLWRNFRFWKQAIRRVSPGWLSAPFVDNPSGRMGGGER